MDYEDFLPLYPSTEDPQLQQRLFEKKEFFDFRLEVYAQPQLEDVPKDNLQRHQRLIQRFLSPQTQFDELLVFHETGTGKTRAAFSATEQILNAQTTAFRKVIFLARGPDQLGNAIAELVSYAKTTDRFKNVDLPENSTDDNQLTIQAYIQRALRGAYEFRTWSTFTGLKGLARMSDDLILNQYNNHIFIVDEAHNIRGSAGGEISLTYLQLFRLFHLLPNRKILLMSGTPMRDQVNEIADIMNLILPLDQQLPVADKFNQEFLRENQIRQQERLKNAFKGRVSYLKTVPDAGIDRIFVGQDLDPNLPIQQFKFFPTQMSPQQLTGYQQAYQTDLGNSTDRTANFYIQARQATLFVFPDGSYGKQGYDTFVRKKRTALSTFVYPVTELQKYSSKYAFVVDQLLQAQFQRQTFYVYSSFVDGSGLQLFAKILEAYGFSRCKGTETTPGKRYIFLTSSPNVRDITKLIKYFNHERNRHGEYCRVIMGSRIISEGFTFKNIRHIHIFTLHWNYTETQQAIARAIRFGSHASLMDQSIQNIPVYIYQHVALGNPGETTIDLQMLQIAQKKDIGIRQMTQLIKEISFDCPLTYERNKGDDEEYKCDQVTGEPGGTNLDTFRLYFQESTDLQVRIAVAKIFQKSSGLPINFYTIQDTLQVDWFQLIRVLSDMVAQNTPIVNAYGIECFLREDRNDYFLVDNILLPNGHRDLSEYTHRPTIVETMTMQELIQKKGFPVYLERINLLKTNFSEEVLQSLPIHLRELYKSLQQKQRQQEVQSETEIYRNAKARGIPYYGTVDQGEKFRIVDIRDTGAITDVRKLKSGSVCQEAGYNKDRIVRVYFGLGVPVEIPDKFQIPDPQTRLLNMKYGPELLQDPELLPILSTLDEEAYQNALRQIITLLEMKKDPLCKTLRDWMLQNGLLAFILSDVKGAKKTKLKGVRVP